jgi:predicted DNA-binding protein
MKRTNINLSDKQDAVLREIAKDTGIKYAEHVRRAIDAYIKQIKREKARESV